MTKLSDWTMKAGSGNEEIAGYVYQQTFKGNTSRTWLSGASQAIAFSIVRKRLGIDWCRAYTIENGNRVVLA